MEDSYQKELDSLSIEMKQQLIKLEELTSEYLNLKSSSFRQFLKNEIVRLSEKHLMSAKYAVTIERSAANFYEFSHKRSNPVIDTAYQRLQQSHLLKAIDAENYRSKIQIVVEGKIFEAWV
ncbi:hypothetical protein SS50377_20771 [Spironucleus salmonicida]|uniref:Uncharacterized protein n=1 Tax=Spironucleus salmonicida TaxID=348837 RepID=V6LR83_9EUKA|nr:hypothetical protein SS50377_20771 [Spironucleus salmonicida]|eukprot:EST47120.1 Hypothetical protein SS50377_12829 [Spironucleus salmonicida]